ncbi:hypothetical protein BTH41_03069 [Bacillus mycoides]|nr:hypothetical protein BTH41_03069 [Bacillus mycoides]
MNKEFLRTKKIKDKKMFVFKLTSLFILVQLYCLKSSFENCGGA